MLEKIMLYVITEHRGKTIGILLGLVASILFISYGFWRTIFIAVCTVDKLEALDANLAQYSKEWSVQRMSSVDRNLLRLASYEILYLEGAQSVVAIDEAIEISKRYSEPASA